MDLKALSLALGSSPDGGPPRLKGEPRPLPLPCIFITPNESSSEDLFSDSQTTRISIFSTRDLELARNLIKAHQQIIFAGTKG